MTDTIAGLTVVGFDPIMLRGDPGPQGPAGPPGAGGTGGGTTVVDNGDGTFTASSTSGSVVDNGNGTFTIS